MPCRGAAPAKTEAEADTQLAIFALCPLKKQFLIFQKFDDGTLIKGLAPVYRNDGLGIRSAINDVI
jgi:hypothetical protein